MLDLSKAKSTFSGYFLPVRRSVGAVPLCSPLCRLPGNGCRKRYVELIVISFGQEL